MSNQRNNGGGGNYPKRSNNNNSWRNGGGGRSNGGSRGFGGSRSGGRSRGRGGRRNSSFDPSMLIQQAVNLPEKPAYIAKNSFADFDVCTPIKEAILYRGYETPTPIQDQAIPLIINGEDIIGLASTGTGKTAAFLIPLINNIYNGTTRKVLIMAPTRELAIQIRSELQIFTENMDIYSALCIGGVPIRKQISAIKRRPEFVIGTPGRLIDLEKRRILNFNDFTTIVLDEVDQMFDMGFIHDMEYVIDRLPEQRHSLFFSATLPPKLNSVVNSFLRRPIKVEVEKQAASANVDQDIVKVNGQAKVDVLHDLLSQEGFDKVLVFGQTKHGLNKLAEKLSGRGFQVAAIHGNKSQGQRQRALQQFKNNRIQILLATDIASRGLDIDDVTHVINFDLPQTYEDYIHRIGRTGRANKTGVALSFVD